MLQESPDEYDPLDRPWTRLVGEQDRPGADLPGNSRKGGIQVPSGALKSPRTP